jgi:hypothetical protein
MPGKLNWMFSGTAQVSHRVFSFFFFVGQFCWMPWDDAIVVSAGKLRKLWDSLSELHSSLFERRLERTVQRPALLAVKTAHFPQFFRQVWRHTLKSLRWTDSVQGTLHVFFYRAMIFASTNSTSLHAPCLFRQSTASHTQSCSVLIRASILRTLHIWDVTQRYVGCWLQTFRDNHSVPSSMVTVSAFKMGPPGCPETSVTNYQLLPRIILYNRRP